MDLRGRIRRAEFQMRVRNARQAGEHKGGGGKQGNQDILADAVLHHPVGDADRKKDQPEHEGVGVEGIVLQQKGDHPHHHQHGRNDTANQWQQEVPRNFAQALQHMGAPRRTKDGDRQFENPQHVAQLHRADRLDQVIVDAADQRNGAAADPGNDIGRAHREALGGQDQFGASAAVGLFHRLQPALRGGPVNEIMN